MKNYPLAKPLITAEDKRAVLFVLDSGHLSLGPQIKEFEKQFAKKIGTKYACAVNNGTAGLHLAMIAAGIKEGDEVITSPFSFVASANCILYVGAKPVFVDIDPVTYNLDPQKIEAKITKRTKAILVVHIFGQSADMDPILKIARKYRLKIVEDACESISATYKGRQVGTFGESAIFAFYPNKQLTTGEGGMLVTNSQRVYKLVKCLSNQGRDDNMRWLDHKMLGYNYRMDEMSAALGLSQLKSLSTLIKKRQQVAGWYHKHFRAFSAAVSIPRTAFYNTHTWFVYVIGIKVVGVDREMVMKSLFQVGVECKPYLPSIHLFSFYKKLGYKAGDFPISEGISAATLSLPFYVGLTEKDIIIISERFKNTIKKYVKRIQR